MPQIVFEVDVPAADPNLPGSTPDTVHRAGWWMTVSGDAFFINIVFSDFCFLFEVCSSGYYWFHRSSFFIPFFITFLTRSVWFMKQLCRLLPVWTSYWPIVLSFSFRLLLFWWSDVTDRLPVSCLMHHMLWLVVAARGCGTSMLLVYMVRWQCV